MEELDISLITKRSIHGVFALVSRTFFIKALNFLVNFLLTVILAPSIFGVYFLVNAFIAFLSYFSDIGLAAALVQKKDELTQEDLKTTFTIQQILVVTIVIIALILSPFIGSFYHLENEGVLLFQALVIGFFISSLKTIPSILLERNLRFEKLVIPEIVETVVFDGVVLILALRGFGVSSFTFAVLARGISGLIAIYVISPWKISIGISRNVAKKLLSFGIPFQFNSFLALLKDDLVFAYIGKILPITQVGYIGFAQNWAFSPLGLIVDNVVRITFPTFSRLQHDAYHLGKAIEKSLFALTLFVFPFLVGLVMLLPTFVKVFPIYHKWDPAIFSLSLFAINAALSSITTPLTNALNAIGKIKISLYLMIFWTIATWVLTPILIFLVGYNGVAVGSALIGFSVIGVVYLAKKYISFSVKPLLTPAFSSVLMGMIIFIISKNLPVNIFYLLCIIVFSGGVYFLSLFLLAKEEVQQDILIVKEHLFKK